ncbi:MAG: hypothetical protein J6C44_01755 [Muribaculaceae bacterium]|nr:hypothetical protein [Muribaculaceae bacterium]
MLLTLSHVGIMGQTTHTNHNTNGPSWQHGVNQLPELIVDSKNHKVLHILAYVRDYSTLTTYTDTISMFREKMVDFMIPANPKTKFKGWLTPRLLNSRSYYRFTNASGLDSVSDRCNHNFSWSDWVGIMSQSPLPTSLQKVKTGSDTIMDRYSPRRVWAKNDDRVSLDVNLLYDDEMRHKLPGVSLFFKKEDIDFERFKLRLEYDNVVEGWVGPTNLMGYKFDIESTGRGHGMFKFNRYDQPYYVTTNSEVYLLDREYITVKEAKKWDKNKPSGDSIGIYYTADTPDLSSEIQNLIARVEGLDHTGIRLALPIDKRVAGPPRRPRNFGQNVLQRLKGMFGIDYLNAKRKNKNAWNQFKRDQIHRNNSH